MPPLGFHKRLAVYHQDPINTQGANHDVIESSDHALSQYGAQRSIVKQTIAGRLGRSRGAAAVAAGRARRQRGRLCARR